MFDIAAILLSDAGFMGQLYSGASMSKDQTPLGSRSNPIVLGPEATAEVDTCGSCKFFQRREPYNGEWRGYCTVELPPWVERKVYDPDSRPPNLVKDTDRCDLYQYTGKFYLVSRLTGPRATQT